MNDRASIRTMLEELNRSSVSGYGMQPLPCELDGKIAALVEAFLGASPQQRSELENTASNDLRSAFRAFAERMASLAVRRSSRQTLILALGALTIEGWQVDRRENLLVVSL